MANSTVKTRIQLKNNTENNWNKSRFILLAGEVIIYSPDDSHPFSRIKIEKKCHKRKNGKKNKGV